MNRFLIELPSGFRIPSLMIACVLGVMLLPACASTAPVASPPVAEPTAPGAITAVTLRGDEIHLARSNGTGCAVETYVPGSELPVRVVAVADFCPSAISFLPDSDLLLEGPEGVAVAGERSGDATYLARASSSDYLTREAGELRWHREGRVAVAAGPWVGPAVILDRENAVIAVRSEPAGDRLVRMEWPDRGDRLTAIELTEPLGTIAAIVPDDDQKELAISFENEGSLDIAIVNAEEPVMNLVPNDPADEVVPRWSPIGYKLSYIVRNDGGDIIRTVHVPTAAMVFVDFPDSAVLGYSWYPDGERLLVAVSSLLESDHVVETNYAGTTKAVVVPPRQKFIRRIERLPGTPAGSALVMPEGLRYGAEYPLVVWAAANRSGGAGFNPDIVPFLSRGDIGLLVINGTPADLSPEAWSAIAETRWVDDDRIWIVGDSELDPGAPESIRRVLRNPDIGTARWVVEQIEEGRVRP